MLHIALISGVRIMLRRLNLFSFSLLFLFALSMVAGAQTPLLKASSPETDRDRDGLAGPVRRVRTEMAKLSVKAGKQTEAQRQLLEATAYDLKGTKTENAYYPISSATLTGKEVYKYDDKGNISEMTLVNADGTLLSKEVYTYDYDFVGNWTKMTTSVAVIENGKLSFEPTEVTYRSISYYLDEATVAKLAQHPPSSNAPQGATVAAAAANNNPKSSVGPVSSGLPVNAGNSGNVARAGAVVPPPTNSSTSKLGLALIPRTAESTTSATTPNTAVADAEPPMAPVRSSTGPKPLLKPVTGGVLNGSAVSLPKPTYPEAAKSVRAQGLVVVEVVIDTNGKVISARAVSGPAVLQQAAVQAAQQARFSPTTLSGQPVRVAGTINYNFALAR
jgi:TonB family protein